MSEFNLLDEPWIPVLDTNGTQRELSLTDVFRQADKIAAITSELPTLDAALLRLLLAIMHASLARSVQDYAEAIDLWRELWENGLPAEEICAYLERWRDRFWLFDDERPFGQVSFAEPPENVVFTAKDVSQLNGSISDGNTPNVFSGRTGSQRNTLIYAEAARWLLHLNSFDVAPAGAPPKPPKLLVKGYGLGWLSQIGLLWLNGENLFQTLMFNFVLKDCSESKPQWEINDKLTETSIQRVQLIPPDNLAELYTIPWRRIKLVKSGNVINGYELWGGCTIDTQNAFIEPMTMWRGSDNAYKPILHDAKKQLWRDFSSLTVNKKQDNAPGIIKWLSEIKYETEIELPMLKIRTAAFGYQKNTKVSDCFSDSLSFNSLLLSSLCEAWIPRITDLLADTEKAVFAVGVLALDLAEASGDRRDNKGYASKTMEGKRDAAKQEAYFRLDEPFRGWLSSIDPQNDAIDKKSDEWRRTAHFVLQRLGKEIINQSGTTAFTGYKNKNAPNAHNKFTYTISKIFKPEEIEI
ncbi:MAG: type I-E CRISPR-associated protein Cse1/CasA [Oscillospiraceae bacterium]|jgi:CRISPR system Cascade subunit CasA|nr:type I-E CRISPR-associated protein Cse1/CasA [Oscillospiraceae bacterium]